MADIIWNKSSIEERKEYIEYLKIFGALSGLFKDHREGSHCKKPYLHYRNHEQLYSRVFQVKDLTRKDSAFDVLGIVDGERIGIGLKTWIHTNDITYQKIAEFNKLAPEEITPIIQNGTAEEVIHKIATLRNERIMLDKRLYKTSRDIYHYITRDDHTMNIVESSYDLIQLDSLRLIDVDKTKYVFSDRLNEYKFYISKSVLLKKFYATKDEIIERVSIDLFDDPFELIRKIKIPDTVDNLIENNEIYLPLYQDTKYGPRVSSNSGINIRHSKSKNKNKPEQLRPEYEIEVRISAWIHRVFPNFFGIDAFNKEHIKNSDFNLILPDGRILRGRIKQDNGKSLQTNPQGALGEWILKDVLGLKNREVVTQELLNILGIDSLKITKIDDFNFKINVAETNAYEKFKLDYKDKMLKLRLRGKQLPYFNPQLFDE